MINFRGSGRKLQGLKNTKEINSHKGRFLDQDLNRIHTCGILSITDVALVDG
jgi:hypothetical protein